MPADEILQRLATLTPYLLQGFGLNILVSLVAMAVGTAIGWGLALMRNSGRARVAGLSVMATAFSRSMPTIVFQFYLVFILPGQLSIPFTELVLPLATWLKAALALAVAVVGFTSDNLTIALAAWKQGDHRVAFLFIPNWTSFALIIVMASSTASIIGVSELLSRCNTVINASGTTELMLPIYLYACLIFFGFCFPLTLLMSQLSKFLVKRLVHRA